MIEEQFGWRVTEQCPNALKVLDTEDLHCLRKGRHQAFKGNQPFTDAYLFNDFAKREIASILRCDVTLMISEFEINLLVEKFHIQNTQLFYLPFLVEGLTESKKEQLPNFKQRKNLVTIGNFMHEPNWQSVLLLKQKIWPKLSQLLPEVELHIYGSYVSQKATQLHKPKERFFIKGFADDVNVIMKNARICTAYLPFGAGLKGKLLDAMTNGTPCAMNSIATEGMFGTLPLNGIKEDDIDAFVKQTAELYNNQSLWETSQTNGFNILKNRFNTADFNLLNHVNSLQEYLSKHRQQHFLGTSFTTSHIAKF